MPAFLHDANVGMEHDMKAMDSIALPMALAVLVYIIRSIRLLALPLLSVGGSICFSFSTMYFVAVSGAMPVVSFAPPMLLSLTLAMSVDYSLFILTRFREEVNNNKTVANVQIVEAVLKSSGHTVVISGCTLAACFFGLCVFPFSALRSAGLGSAIAILATVRVARWMAPVPVNCCVKVHPDFPPLFPHRLRSTSPLSRH
jgi:uncharacterized membrane protein YdfJ with MMPL/SSD domain